MSDNDKETVLVYVYEDDRGYYPDTLLLRERQTPIDDPRTAVRCSGERFVGIDPDQFEFLRAAGEVVPLHPKGLEAYSPLFPPGTGARPLGECKFAFWGSVVQSPDHLSVYRSPGEPGVPADGLFPDLDDDDFPGPGRTRDPGRMITPDRDRPYWPLGRVFRSVGEEDGDGNLWPKFRIPLRALAGDDEALRPSVVDRSDRNAQMAETLGVTPDRDPLAPGPDGVVPVPEGLTTVSHAVVLAEHWRTLPFRGSPPSPVSGDNALRWREILFEEIPEYSETSQEYIRALGPSGSAGTDILGSFPPDPTYYQAMVDGVRAGGRASGGEEILSESFAGDAFPGDLFRRASRNPWLARLVAERKLYCFPHLSRFGRLPTCLESECSLRANFRFWEEFASRHGDFCPWQTFAPDPLCCREIPEPRVDATGRRYVVPAEFDVNEIRPAVRRPQHRDAASAWSASVHGYGRTVGVPGGHYGGRSLTGGPLAVLDGATLMAAPALPVPDGDQRDWFAPGVGFASFAGQPGVWYAFAPDMRSQPCIPRPDTVRLCVPRSGFPVLLADDADGRFPWFLRELAGSPNTVAFALEGDDPDIDAETRRRTWGFSPNVRETDVVGFGTMTEGDFREGDFFECEECGERFHVDDLAPGLGRGICDSCAESLDEDERFEEGCIRSYDYAPSCLVFRHEAKLPAKGFAASPCPRRRSRGKLMVPLEYYGAELEISFPGEDKGGFSEDFSRVFDSDMFYLKMDGSLDDGLEIVSHPMTRAACLEYWGKVMDALAGFSDDYRMRSHNGGECGFHVHVTREALSHLHWGKILVFCNDKSAKTRRLLEGICQRDSAQWAKVYEKKFKDAHPRNRNLGTNSDRYQFWNLNPRKTNECRACRGNLRKDRVFKNFEFVWSLVDWTRDESARCLDHRRYLDFLHRHEEEYPRLVAFVRETLDPEFHPKPLPDPGKPKVARKRSVRRTPRKRTAPLPAAAWGNVADV